MLCGSWAAWTRAWRRQAPTLAWANASCSAWLGDRAVAIMHIVVVLLLAACLDGTA